MTRTYDMRGRARAAERTRRAIIDAAHTLLDRPDGGRLTLEDVARAAGVTRATVYNRVGSRPDLLAAVFKDQGRLIDFDRVLAAMTYHDPVEAALRTVRESCRAWSLRPIAIRRTLALSAVDEEVSALVDRYERSRRRHLRTLAKRLRSPTGPVTAASEDVLLSTLTLTTSFQAYELLTLDHSHAAATRRLEAMTAATLAADTPRARRASR